MGARGDIVRAIVAGRIAGRTGRAVTTCPYPATSLLRAAWVKGYAETRPALTTEDDDQAVDAT